jgi:hypothetical protein
MLMTDMRKNALQCGVSSERGGTASTQKKPDIRPGTLDRKGKLPR